MKWLRADYLAAIAFSLAVHAGIVASVQPDPVETRIAGGEEVAVMMIGDAFADAIMAGEEADAAEAVDEAEPVEPVTETAEAVEEVVQPVDTEAAEAVSKDVQANEPLQALAALSDPQSPVAVSEEILKPVPDPPVPQPRPKAEKKPPESRQPERKAVPEKKAAKEQSRKAKEDPKPKKPAAKTSTKTEAKKKKGSGGEQKADARKSASGSKTAKRSNQAGNASVSNYPGKVHRKVSRAIRYPKQARAKRLRGQAVVSFVVGSNGSVSGIRVARSSGHSILDNAALDTVRRAAPFPPIPSGAGRSSWAFSVPLAFTR